MKSKAAIGTHPIHPAIVPLPIGAFSLALIGDVVHAYTREPFWYRFAFICIGIGILTAIVAALFGMLDYFGVRMSRRGASIATTHMVLNLGVVALYAVNLLLRRDDAALLTSRWPFVFGLDVVAYVALGISGWLGGKLAYEHKVGVVERLDPEATSIGMGEHG
jgi:uncharacterized membrane protein